jgi:NAD(P)-dependent dehydrogenase (short-subunit alcohol dehydrogenase family)
MKLMNSTVLVTGAAGTLGRAVADAFAERGANLVLVDLRREKLEKSFGAENEHRLFVPTDLLDAAQVAATARAAIDRFERIDVLCNIAGGFRMGEGVHETSDGTWNFLLDVNGWWCGSPGGGRAGSADARCRPRNHPRGRPPRSADHDHKSS